MPYAEDLDPSDSVLSFYVTDLRRRREAAGITQRDFARTALMAPSLLNKIEAAQRLPTKELSALADEKFGTGDHFRRLWPLVIKYAYPKWFRPYVELEAAATIIRSFEVQTVPGLLQTEEYGREVLAAGRTNRDEIEELLNGRMGRQAILDRPKPPELWIVIDETVILRRPGCVDNMAGQLQRLLDVSGIPNIVIQVLPFDVGGHAGVDGPFTTLTMDEGPNVVYVDGFLKGQILAEPDDVRTAERAYDLLTAEALSISRSVDLIAKALKELTP
ncbi:helix-turn-helix domain-containing protein [Streptomyces sp. NBC_01497]|uniref:helix-turn-helix domain-containing protein n=1 Tax=Streptomyces sp. NBC_01497 TaxID=2903885 RepID=UPI002E2F5D1B|nr:helix-turn-helix transcriptional regulator [Streptomyces sp. NBC_01497]